MVILRTRNKITDFMMILAWASPFKLVRKSYQRRSTFFYVENGVILLFLDEIPRVWRFFKMASMSVSLEES